MAVACGHTEPFLWIDSVPATVTTPPAAYIIFPGDVLSVRVWEQEAMSTRARVRDDGKISLPLVNDLQAAGNTPLQLARGIEETLRARQLFNNPRVTVNIEETHSTTVTVCGEVAHAGSFSVGSEANLLQVLANAGGLTEFADRDRIFVIRQGTGLPRIRFRYRDLLLPTRAADFRLANGDVVLVE
jgi:polysaccharide export outer membrane protein